VIVHDVDVFRRVRGCSKGTHAHGSEKMIISKHSSYLTKCFALDLMKDGVAPNGTISR
jgi:hypothetical protein